MSDFHWPSAIVGAIFSFAWVVMMILNLKDKESHFTPKSTEDGGGE